MIPRLLLPVLLATLSCSSSQKNTESSPKNLMALTLLKHAEALKTDPKIHAVSIGIHKDGKTYTRHAGELDPDQNNMPTDATLYEIASVSKSFTGTLVAQAVLDQKLDLEDEVQQFLEGDYSNLVYEGQPIQIKHLLTHTAGLPRFFPTQINALFEQIDENLPHRIHAIEKAYSKTAFLQDLQAATIEVPPGTEYRYSNADVELLGHILEQVYELPYEQLLQQFICRKARMKNTKVHLSPKEAQHLANGYGAANNAVPHFANTLWGAGSGLKSTTADLMRYAQFQLEEGNKAAQASHQVLYANDDLQIAYLWPVYHNETDGTHYRMHGGAFGTQNFLLIVPKHQLGISIITNQSGPETQGKLERALQSLLNEIRDL